MPVPPICAYCPLVSATPLAGARGREFSRGLPHWPAEPPLRPRSGSRSSAVLTGVPIRSIMLLALGGRQECLITILWPGFCCIPQTVYVMCSAYLSRCYFIPAVGEKITKTFMYSQLIVTCLWSMPAQNERTNKQPVFPIINKC